MRRYALLVTCLNRMPANGGGSRATAEVAHVPKSKIHPRSSGGERDGAGELHLFLCVNQSLRLPLPWKPDSAGQLPPVNVERQNGKMGRLPRNFSSGPFQGCRTSHSSQSQHDQNPHMSLTLFVSNYGVLRTLIFSEFRNLYCTIRTLQEMPRRSSRTSAAAINHSVLRRELTAGGAPGHRPKSRTSSIPSIGTADRTAPLKRCATGHDTLVATTSSQFINFGWGPAATIPSMEVPAALHATRPPAESSKSLATPVPGNNTPHPHGKVAVLSSAALHMLGIPLAVLTRQVEQIMNHAAFQLALASSR